MASNKSEQNLSFDDFDELHNPRPESSDFEGVVERMISRRGFLAGGLKLGAGSMLLGFGLSGCDSSSSPEATQDEAVKILRKFNNLPANSNDTVTVPEEFEWDIVVKWGDPLFDDSVEFNEETRGTADSQLKAFGDNTDGMALFQDPKTGKQVLAVNNEYTNIGILWGNNDPAGKPATQDDILKGMYAHGISVVEIEEVGGRWQVVKGSSYNRRITPKTVMDITGPLAGDYRMGTNEFPTGMQASGTWNNCGNGRTPWGTYLTCEENFNGYFSVPNNTSYQPSAELSRYGISGIDWGYAWAEADDRFDLEVDPNMPNTAGYVVEINPFDPSSTPRKLTALGRFKHENAECVIADNSQKIVVYMGDDERGEYIYRYVSDASYNGSNGPQLLENGTLYAAKFNDDGTGSWLALTPESTNGMSKADICVYTRMAASAVAATTMDRPEWVATNPNNNHVFCCLTNNSNRGVEGKTNAGGDDMGVNGPNPRAQNLYGQIVRIMPENDEHDADNFEWDLYAMAGNPEVYGDAYAGSANITTENMFNSPDGLGIDPNGNLWIQTDGNYSDAGDFKGMGNNQMLIGDSSTGEIKRVLVGPNECEVTGLTFSADYKTAFVGIQHPGEKGNSHFPAGGTSVPRSCIVSLKRKDGGKLV